MKVTGNQPAQKPNSTTATSKPAKSNQLGTQSKPGGTSFSQTLAQTQKPMSLPSAPLPVSRWSSLGFLATSNMPHMRFPFTHSQMPALARNAPIVSLKPLTTTAQNFSILAATASPAPVKAAPSTHVDEHLPAQALSLIDYPHPAGDNGRGIHWIPTISQSKETVDTYVEKAVAMNMKWVVFLNEGNNIGKNDYLVKKLTDAGIEPVMRIYTPGVSPVDGDIKSMVQHYVGMGMHYFQIYNEPNLRVETYGKPADVQQYVKLWSEAAQQVVDGGGYPGFGALSPQGEMDDRTFLRQSLQELKRTDKVNLLNKGWLAMHNYTGPRPLNDPDGFLRFQQYNDIISDELGRSIPIIGTEGGTHLSPLVNKDQQINMMTGAYKYMAHREPYNFAYTYWIIANGHDPAWAEHALFTENGATPLAQALLNMDTGGSA